ncbi:hypothetical protein [Nonomuraea cavernae]|uniref:Uncharacterized protein n=1 Tax=Nonomuraea cavernae TaxID=2045107 RepID=A0A918DL19_9ACTN|nr:hypothetical protein [Nonomuraea cavernae]MCA2188084.1 hypothetical protein [Nonomuraea cavernae]GGO72743.1 hypothetical protein GCM10012289_41530 [Nonomuraea cavernae]
MLTEERREQFRSEVARMRLKTDRSRHDGKARALGALLMVAGVVGALIAYNNSLSQDDARDIASFQILATACVSVTVLGAALYLAAAVAGVLRLWLLRQLVEGQAQADQLAEALRERRD